MAKKAPAPPARAPQRTVSSTPPAVPSLSPAETLQKRLDAGGLIQLPAGEIVTNAPLTFTKPVILQGVGPQTVIRATHAGSVLIGKNFEGLTIRDLRIIGPSRDPESNWLAGKTHKDFSSVGIDLYRVHYPTIENVFVGSCGNRGISLEHCYHGVIRNVQVKRNGIGVHGYSLNGWTVSGLHAQYNFIGTQNVSGQITSEANLLWNVVFGAAGFADDCPQHSGAGGKLFAGSHLEQGGRAGHAVLQRDSNGARTPLASFDGFPLGDVLLKSEWASLICDSVYFANNYGPAGHGNPASPNVIGNIVGSRIGEIVIGPGTRFMTSGDRSKRYPAIWQVSGRAVVHDNFGCLVNGLTGAPISNTEVDYVGPAAAVRRAE